MYGHNIVELSFDKINIYRLKASSPFLPQILCATFESLPDLKILPLQRNIFMDLNQKIANKWFYGFEPKKLQTNGFMDLNQKKFQSLSMFAALLTTSESKLCFTLSVARFIKRPAIFAVTKANFSHFQKLLMQTFQRSNMQNFHCQFDFFSIHLVLQLQTRPP